MLSVNIYQEGTGLAVTKEKEICLTAIVSRPGLSNIMAIYKLEKIDFS